LSRSAGVLAALKAAPGGGRHTLAPQSGGYGPMNSVAANAMYGNAYQGGYGPFLPRPSRTFTDGAFGPMSPTQPVPVDEPAYPGGFPEPRLWQYPISWNLPTQPGSEGLKLASFSQLRTIAEKYSVARRCIELRKDEIRGMEWSIEMTTEAAMAYQGDHKAMRDFGERAAKATKFFKKPDPDYWNFASWLGALLEEVFVFDALSLIFRPKYGKGLGRGLLGSDLDSLSLISGMTVRPLLNMHGGKPQPPAPAYSQFLYSVPRSDFQTIMSGSDIDDYGLTGAEVNSFRADTMLYAPLVTRRETPYGFPFVEQALLPIISGLQKQEYQLSYYTEGTVPAVYISPGDPNMTPTQIRELQDALNGIAGDPSYHLKVIVLPPGSKVEPQRPVDLADTFDTLVQTQVCMAADVMPDELGILPNVGSAGAGGASNASAIRFASGESRDPKGRKSTKPLLMTLCDIANYVLQDICGQQDMQFAFEGLQAEDDKQSLVDRGVQGIQNGLYSIDEVRGWLDLPPWGLPETSEPVVFTAQGPVPFSMAPELIRAAITGDAAPSRGQGTNSGQRSPSSRSRTSQPSIRAGGTTKPNGSHPAPVAPHREAPLTPGHSAAAGAIQSPTPRTGGTTSRSSVAGSRKKAVQSELGALARHLRKGRLISTWVAEHIPERALGMIAEDIAKGVLLDVAVERAESVCLKNDEPARAARAGVQPVTLSVVGPVPFTDDALNASSHHWPGWERDLGLVGAYKQQIGQAFHDAETRASGLRKKAATGAMFVSNATLRDLIGDEVREVFAGTLTPLWTEAWHLGYAAAKSLVTGQPADFAAKDGQEHLAGFIGTEGEHWLASIARTGLGNNSARSEMIARTEVARAVNSAAIQCYRDHGVTHKHLLLADDACDLCKEAAEDGIIPLDAPFSSGGVLGLSHPGDRCCPGPSGVDVEPPLADLGKSAQEDRTRAGFLMLRARHPDDGKWHYLLQKRPDGGWGLPGGSTHEGEDVRAAAVRESTEEIGDLPPLGSPKAVLQFRDGARTAWVHLHEVPFFQPANNGSTPWETAGTGWFKRREVGDLDLHPPFREQWETADWHAIGKSLQRTVNENGEVSVLTEASQRLQAVGSRWPYPHRADGTEQPEGAPGDVPGGTSGEMGAAEPPNRINDFAEPEPHGDVAPRGGDDGEMPSHGRKPNLPASRFPDQGDEDDDAWPQAQTTLTPGAVSVGSPKSQAGTPVVGSVPAKTPEPYAPHAVAPETVDPGENVEDWSPEAGSDVVQGKGAAQVTDANPVEWRHVYAQLEGQFPDKALEWVKHSTWAGPLNVPWSRIDAANISSWAASHQPEAVARFAREIDRGGAHTNPSVLFHQANHPDGREVIADGHHRAMARHFKLGKPVLAYVGTVPARWMKQALEMHSSQLHSGGDRANKSAQTPELATHHAPIGHEGVWGSKNPPLQYPPYLQNVRNALIQDGHSEAEAHELAIGALRRWAAGEGNVHPEVQQASRDALAEYDRERQHHP
jgi:8-oxo-dGTP pyrophosphatase MutT (NUDIX family)